MKFGTSKKFGTGYCNCIGQHIKTMPSIKSDTFEPFFNKFKYTFSYNCKVVKVNKIFIEPWLLRNGSGKVSSYMLDGFQLCRVPPLISVTFWAVLAFLFFPQRYWNQWWIVKRTAWFEIFQYNIHQVAIRYTYTIHILTV